MFFNEERVDAICLLARKRLAMWCTEIIKEIDYRGTSYKQDDLERYWDILSAIEYRKAFDNASDKFQDLVFLLYNRLNLAKLERTPNSNYITVGTPTSPAQSTLEAIINYIINVLLPQKANDSDVLHVHGNETKHDLLTFLLSPQVPYADSQFDAMPYGQILELINNIPTYELPVASEGQLGGVKEGDNVTIEDDGTISVDISLQASTDEGNTTTNDIVLNKSKVTFLTENNTVAASVNGAVSTIERDSEGYWYVIDRSSSVVKKFEKDFSSYTTILGNGTGLNTFYQPNHISFDSQGNIVVSDYGNYRFIKFLKGTTTGSIIGPNGGHGSGLNQVINAKATLFDEDDNLYIFDSGNYRILKFAPGATSGVIVAGGNGIGTGLNQLTGGNDLRWGPDGLLYAADTYNKRILKFDLDVSPVGIIAVASNGTGAGLDQFGSVFGFDFDSAGNIYLADVDNRRIMKFAPGATSGVVVSGGNGSGSDLNQYNFPYDILVSPNGNFVYVADYSNGRIIIDYIGSDSVHLTAGAGQLYRNGKRLLTEEDIFGSDFSHLATKTEVTTADLVLQENINTLTATKVNKHISQTPTRIMFVGPDGSIIGQGNFTFDMTTGQMKVNTTVSNGNYKALIGGGLSLLSGSFNMDEFQSILYMSGGRCALIVDGNGMHYRLFNNDETNFPDTSKSFVWRNKGFVHFRCYTNPLALNGSGQPTEWEQINSFEKSNRFPDVADSAGSYKVAVINNSTKKLETVNVGLGTLSPEFIASLPIINDGDVSALDTYELFRTTSGAYGTIGYKKPAGLAGKFNSKFNSKFV